MGQFLLIFQSLAPEVWGNRVKRATFHGMKELVARIFQALTLIAGLLWSGACAAECRILPDVAQKAQPAQRELPPCHKQHDPSPSKNFGLPGCSTTSEEVAQKQLQLPDFATVELLDDGVLPGGTTVVALLFTQTSHHQATPSTIRILRI